MTVRVLCDAIHADLWESLRLLFEGRLGWELYAPTGMGWWDAGIWRFEREHLGDQVARQFLEPWVTDAQVKDVVDLLDMSKGVLEYSLRPGTTHPASQKRVTVEQARSMPWDIVLSTLAENDLGWAGFAREVGAHFGIQVGNQGAEVLWGAAEFAMLSVTTPGFTPWKPHVYYRQEFSLRDFHADGGLGALARPAQLLPEVATRVQCIQGTPEYAIFRELAHRTQDCARWRWYGHCGEPDEHFGGNALSTVEVAQQMHGARVAYHAKRWSDGYGHVIHNWAAIGRPMLVTATYYADKLAGPLFVEGETSYDLERHSVAELEDIVRRLATDDDLYLRMCERAAERFRTVVDFDAEAEAIRDMLSDVLSSPVPR